jgi:alkanesulfonate monooxygenase SsuD/methylene tetrahydromethanopterin reductase-like flavin-dependent oxidoreductase (luciferase family)
MKLGTWLPTFTDFPANERVPMLIRFAKRAEELGFSSLWTIDHILRIVGNPTYANLSWLDPFQCLSLIASHTSIPLGTIYCGILRNPVVATKEIASLMYLTQDRFVLSPVLGWMDEEFEVAGFTRATRGRRMDEWLEAMELLLTQENASYDGRFYSFHDITVDPLPGKRPTMYVTGGGAYYEPDAKQDEASLKPRVVDRILRYDGWFASTQSSVRKSKADWTRLTEAARARGDDPARLTVLHANYVYIVETNDRQKALDVQAPFWNARRTIDSSFDEMVGNIYMAGTVDDIIENIRLRKESFGMTEFIVNSHPGHEEEQLELWAKHLLPAVSSM